MGKENAKYVRGEPIKSLDELMAQELIYCKNKIYHRGWFGSWQTFFAKRMLDSERVFKVTRTENITN